jgi:hypothetical protein
MSVFERLSTNRRHAIVDVSSRATCLRCRREYTREPDAPADDEYCWWCAARISQNQIPVVPE